MTVAGMEGLTSLELGPILAALAIAAEGVPVVAVVAIALGLPAGQPVHVDVGGAEAQPDVPLPALAYHLHLEVVQRQRGRDVQVCSDAGCILVCAAWACSSGMPWDMFEDEVS